MSRTDHFIFVVYRMKVAGIYGERYPRRTLIGAVHSASSHPRGLSWVTRSTNQDSRSDFWLGVISVKARPIPKFGSQ
jgi:hypothetical protein